jgi:hypothetical protein
MRSSAAVSAAAKAGSSIEPARLPVPVRYVALGRVIINGAMPAFSVKRRTSQLKNGTSACDPKSDNPTATGVAEFGSLTYPTDHDLRAKAERCSYARAHTGHSAESRLAAPPVANSFDLPD